MRTWRITVQRLLVNGIELEVGYADVFVVLRDGDAEPGPSDWEATVRTPERQHLPPATYELQAHVPDGTVLEGRAVLRFSDGTRHLFRGDGHLSGFDPAA